MILLAMIASIAFAGIDIKNPIGALSLDSTKLGAASVDSDKIADAAVSTTKLATDAVTNAKVLKGSLDSTKLESGGATETGKIACWRFSNGKPGHCSAFTLSPNGWEFGPTPRGGGPMMAASMIALLSSPCFADRVPQLKLSESDEGFYAVVNPTVVVVVSTVDANAIYAAQLLVSNATIASTITVVGNAFSVGGSTLVVTGGRVGIGTTQPNFGLESFGGYYLHGDGFTGALAVAGNNFRVNGDGYFFYESSGVYGGSIDSNAMLRINGPLRTTDTVTISTSTNDFEGVTILNTGPGASSAAGFILENDVADTVTVALAGSNNGDLPGVARKLLVMVADDAGPDPFYVMVSTKALTQSRPLCLTSNNTLGVCSVINVVTGDCTCTAP